MRTKLVSFFIFFQELSNKKKFKELRPKMTKIASRGSCLKYFTKISLIRKFVVVQYMFTGHGVLSFGVQAVHNLPHPLVFFSLLHQYVIRKTPGQGHLPIWQKSRWDRCRWEAFTPSEMKKKFKLNFNRPLLAPGIINTLSCDQVKGAGPLVLQLENCSRPCTVGAEKVCRVLHGDACFERSETEKAGGRNELSTI